MTTLNNFQGQTNGAAVSTTNSGDSGTPFSGVFKNNGSLTYDSSQGSMALKSVDAVAENCFVECTNFGADVNISAAFDYYFSATKTANRTIFQVRSAGGAVTSVIRNTGDTFSMTDAGGAVRWTSTTNFNSYSGQWLRIELQIFSDASAGTMQLSVFPQASNTAIEASNTITGRNTRGGAITIYRMGKVDSSAETQGDWFDNVRSQDATLTSLGPYVAANNAPIANAGNDVVSIEPWTTQSLSGTDSDSDGTVATRTWRQISGTTVSLTGSGATRTYLAPGTIAGTALVFGYRVTDDGGTDSTESTVTHTVLAATERAVMGGVEVPVRTKVLEAGQEV